MEKIELSDEQVIIFANTVSEQIQHIKPSQETKKMLSELDKKYESTDKKVDRLGFSLDLHINDNKHFNEETSRKLNETSIKLEEIKTVVKDGLSGKAGKWVEAPMKILITTVSLGVLYALLELVIKK